ncbi:MAG: hypothetical protein J6X55_03290 [Victivallales bacterium]|nr:hypothetical protein [Victivallales bacterium]
MPKSTYEITHETADWSAAYDYTEANGPLTLAQNGTVFLKNHVNTIDDRGMIVIKSRSFHKAGTAVNDTETSFNATGASGFRQITRYANNVARITTDISIKRDTIVKKVLRLGSFELVGKWCRMMVINRDGTAQWTELTPGELVQQDISPLAWIFEREDGFRCEVATGFDLWRWTNGIDGIPMKTVISINEDGIAFDRQIISTVEPVPPNPRDYRFCYHIAWSSPKTIQPATDDIPAIMDISKGVLDLSALGESPALSLDMTMLPLPPGAFVNGTAGNAICWESKATLSAIKPIIRQLAANFPNGQLHFINGLTPSVCTFGKHVDRPRAKTIHWDLNGIICFAQWVRQNLGDGWIITSALDGIWSELPSLQCLFGANGFNL